MIDEVPLFTRNDGTILKDRAAVHVPIETTGVTLPRR
jgi:hypothetical protein